MTVKTELRKFLRDEGGATAIEYGLLAALIAVAIVGGAYTLGLNLNNLFKDIANCLTKPSSTCTIGGTGTTGG